MDLHPLVEIVRKNISDVDGLGGSGLGAAVLASFSWAPPPVLWAAPRSHHGGAILPEAWILPCACCPGRSDLWRSMIFRLPLAS